MKKMLRDNGLSLILFGVFFLALFVGQVLTGEREYNDSRQEHGREKVTLGEYLLSAHFMEATMENWESEFLQMGAFVILSAMFVQRGSAESKDPDKEEDVDEDPSKHRHDPNAPWPVRKGGWVLAIYSQSLSLAFVLRIRPFNTNAEAERWLGWNTLSDSSSMERVQVDQAVGKGTM